MPRRQSRRAMASIVDEASPYRGSASRAGCCVWRCQPARGSKMLWGRRGETAPSSLQPDDGVRPMSQPKDDLSRSLVALDQCGTLIAVVELSLATWLVGGMIPGIERDPLKKLVPDEEGLLKLLHRWCDEAVR